MCQQPVRPLHRLKRTQGGGHVAAPEILLAANEDHPLRCCCRQHRCRRPEASSRVSETDSRGLKIPGPRKPALRFKAWGIAPTCAVFHRLLFFPRFWQKGSDSCGFLPPILLGSAISFSAPCLDGCPAPAAAGFLFLFTTCESAKPISSPTMTCVPRRRRDQDLRKRNAARVWFVQWDVSF